MTAAYAVIVPAYNEERLLLQTLSLLKTAMDHQAVPGEVIVVDNNSTDGTAATARAAGATVVFEPVNQISRARNAGARRASAPWLLFLDADTLPTPALLTAALGRLEGGAVGGGALIELVAAGAPPKFAAVVPLFSRALMKLGICGGSFIYCRREAFEAVGGFSEKVYAAEDVLMSRDLRRWGRQHGRPFEILADTPIRSSDRKLHAHSPLSIALFLALFALFPWAVRFRALCRFWYRRSA